MALVLQACLLGWLADKAQAWQLVIGRLEMGPWNAQLNQGLGTQSSRTSGLQLTSLVSYSTNDLSGAKALKADLYL